ncbi:kynureninase [Shewanella sp. NIFS-20-20]|uniref:kynureninase n=1 Tax=Shewanella sp. NIFS-20-20 TaxID=2853806 RepID=UPI001C43A4F6|nr:kynureninase [Shewanella sp. NIFS-20-20]MBV7315115.1 kynureninase [Shewanella sp. NIFS-20-20]
MNNLSRQDCQRLDLDDPLAVFRDEFQLPIDSIYLCGNSLGAMPKKALTVAAEVVTAQWGIDLVKSWNAHGWFQMATDIGDMLAPTIGAEPGEVVMTDSTSINLFKVVSAALMLQPKRYKILMEGSNFPTDNYTIQGLIKLLGESYEIIFAEGEDIVSAIDDTIAVVCLTQVHYKTGRVLEMMDITSKAHEVGSVTVWDLCHSAGAMDVDLNACQADFAIGCTYKYYNGGPGSPAFIFAAKRHHGAALQPLTGWWGHQAPFNFERDYRPATGIHQMLTGTQPIITMAVSKVGIEIATRANIKQVRQKSLALGNLFIELLEHHCGDYGFELVSPRDHTRGSQVALRHDQGYAIMQALIDAGVVGDFRAPDILRFGLTPLYLRYVDVWDAVMKLKSIMTEQTWQLAKYHQRQTVT